MTSLLRTSDTTDWAMPPHPHPNPKTAMTPNPHDQPYENCYTISNRGSDTQDGVSPGGCPIPQSKPRVSNRVVIFIWLVTCPTAFRSGA